MAFAKPLSNVITTTYSSSCKVSVQFVRLLNGWHPSEMTLLVGSKTYHIQLWRSASVCNELHQDIGNPNSLFNFREPFDVLFFNFFEGAIIVLTLLILSLSKFIILLITQL